MKPVQGEHCRYQNFYAANHPQLNLAIADALSLAPGSIGLKNVKISEYRATGYGLLAVLFPILGVVGFPLSEICYKVEGIPTK